jgi:hypothetical protein
MVNGHVYGHRRGRFNGRTGPGGAASQTRGHGVGAWIEFPAAAGPKHT